MAADVAPGAVENWMAIEIPARLREPPFIDKIGVGEDGGPVRPCPPGLEPCAGDALGGQAVRGRGDGRHGRVEAWPRCDELQGRAAALFQELHKAVARMVAVGETIAADADRRKIGEPVYDACAYNLLESHLVFGSGGDEAKRRGEEARPATVEGKLVKGFGQFTGEKWNAIERPPLRLSRELPRPIVEICARPRLQHDPSFAEHFLAMGTWAIKVRPLVPALPERQTPPFS